jgi:ubiquinone/menaquinone biosynthesis C-methylase UbiE
VYYQVDFQKLLFGDGQYDFVFVSHVLEHIRDDQIILSDIGRILKTNAIAVLPISIVSEKTVEYPASNPDKAGHVRALGPDYFDKYSFYFSRVEMFNSDDFLPDYQFCIYEDRTSWLAKNSPLRPVMEGEKHSDVVPVCFV